MSDVQNPHDRFFREVFARPEAVEGFLRYYLPPEVAGHLDPGLVQRVPGTFVDPGLRAHHADAVFEVGLRGGGTAYLYVLVEHKSHPDRSTPFQLLKYVVRLWEHAIRVSGAGPLPPVIPVVLYHGRQQWWVPRDAADLAEGCPEGLREYQPSLRYVLCDLGRYADEEIRGAAVLRAAFLVMKHIFDEELVARLPEALGLLGDLLDTRTGLEAVEVLLQYVSAATDRVGEEDLRQAVKEALGPKGEGIMPTLAQRWLEEGMKKGLQQGLQQGVQQGATEGRLAALRDAVIDVLEARFDTVPGDLLESVGAMDDPAKLKILHRKAVRAETLDEVRLALKVLQGPRTGPGSQGG